MGGHLRQRMTSEGAATIFLRLDIVHNDRIIRASSLFCKLSMAHLDKSGTGEIAIECFDYTPLLGPRFYRLTLMN